MSQKTLSIVKPDGTEKNLIGEVVARFQRRLFDPFTVDDDAVPAA